MQPFDTCKNQSLMLLKGSSESESDVTCGQVWLPILRICSLQLTHPKCTHTAVNTHTHHEHTPRVVGSHLCCGARGAVGGSVPCSRAPQLWYWRCTPCRTWGSNSQPLGYESDSLTISPRLPHLYYFFSVFWFYWTLNSLCCRQQSSVNIHESFFFCASLKNNCSFQYNMFARKSS